MISSRTLLIGLIALNLVVFLWLMGLLPIGAGSERDPDRLINQIEPQKLELVRPGGGDLSGSAQPSPQTGRTLATGPDNSLLQEPPPQSFDAPGQVLGLGREELSSGVPGLAAAAGQIARGAGASAGALTDPTSPVVKTMASPASATASATTDDSCILFPESDYLQARQQIEQFVPSLARARLRRLDAGSYLVFLDPLASSEAAKARRDDLVSAGVLNAQVITTGALRDGISLGLLRTVGEAERRLREVYALGVEQAAIGPLSVATSRYRVEMSADTVVIEQSVRPAALAAGIALEPCF